MAPGLATSAGTTPGSTTPGSTAGDDTRPAARLRRLRPARPPLPVLGWLAATIALSTSVGATVPRTGLDGSWITAINVAAAEDRRFLRDALFPFGPWGFLERPLLISRPQYVLGVLFAVAAATAMFWAVYRCVRRVAESPRAGLPPAVAAPAAFVATLATPLTDPGLRLLCAATVFALLVLERRAAGEAVRDPWPGALLALAGAVLLQVKFSEGLAMLVLAAVVTVFVRRLGWLARNVAASAAAFAVATVGAWLAAGQPLGDFPPWLRYSWALASGYQEAMATERPDGVTGYLLAAVLALVVGTLAGRRVAGLGTVLVGFAMLGFGFKHGFTRHDPAHEVTYFMIVGFLLLGLAVHARRPVAVLVVAALALALVPAGVNQFDPFAARDRWRAALAGMVNDDHRTRLVADARRRARAEYRVPPGMVEQARGRPVSVDPWEATLPWAYSMDWSPVPVFQAYSAYTPSLDAANARDIARAPADQIVLRQSREAIDGRNARWETPRYLLALACNYTAGTNEGGWSLLRHGGNRCGGPRSVEARRVAAGEAVRTPTPGPDEILVARFTPAPDGFLVRAGGLVLKDWSRLVATADGRRYRLPEGLAGGPLLVAFPAALGWAAPFDGFRYERLSFNRPGRLEFQLITVG